MSRYFVRSVGCLLVLWTVGIWGGSSVAGEAARDPATTHAVAGGIQSRQVLCPPGSGGVLCTAGTFTGDLEGPFTFAVDTVAPSGVEGFSLMTYKVVAQTNNGDLFLEGAAVADLRSGWFAGLAGVTGGTGKWKGSSGQLRWATTPDASGGRHGEYIGIITAG